MHKYRTNCCNNKIEKREIIRESRQTIWINGYNDKPMRVRKFSDFDQYHDTFEDAKLYLINKSRLKIESLQDNLGKELMNLEEIRSMEDEDA